MQDEKMLCEVAPLKDSETEANTDLWPIFPVQLRTAVPDTRSVPSGSF